jgi:hypothetical protein
MTERRSGRGRAWTGYMGRSPYVPTRKTHNKAVNADVVCRRSCVATVHAGG